jgi:outer membrane receptor protein involved in Fe transport
MSKFVHRAGARARFPHSAFRRKPIALAISLALLSSQAVFAADDARKDDASELGEVTVTGSRIRQAVGMETPTPVTAISITELQTMAPASISEAMTQLPQFYNSQTAENFGSVANGFFTSPGGGALNLRNIGTARTLTLLDGRRMPAASIFGVPDINTFPDQLMARIETVTGGASAAYGTDAVSGVVNYILDTKFEGFKASAQFGQSDRGDGANEKYSIAAGHALGDKAHILFSAGHSSQNAINHTGDRDWYQSCGLVQNPANGGAGTSLTNPSLVPACNLRSSVWSIDGVLNPKNATNVSAPGAAYVAGLGEVTFGPNGQVMAFNQGTTYGGNVQSGGSGEDLNDVLNVLLSPSKRSNAFTYFDYDVTDDFNVYVQGIYSKQLLARAGLVGNLGGGALPGFHPLTIYRDNAFLPTSIFNYMTTNNITALQFNRQMSPYDGVLGSQEQHNRLSAGTVGFKSTIRSDGYFNGWAVDGYFQYGTTNLDWAQIGGQRQDRIFLAADAVKDANGVIKCRVTVVSGAAPDCVPINLFGRGAPSQAAIDWVTGFDPGVSVTTTPWIASAQAYGQPYSYVGDEAKHRLTKLNQRVAEVTTSGNLFEGWAGPVQAAFGANYRREAVDQRVQASQGNPAADPNFFPVWCNDPGVANLVGAQCTAAVMNRQVSTGTRRPGVIGVRGVPGNAQSNLVETQFSNVPFIRGNYDIKELFNETVFPLLKDQPFMKSLTFQGAVRWADYAGSGQIWSYKAGLDAQFTKEIRLRGTYSRDVRAGNISDRFDRTGGIGSAIDRKTAPAGGPPTQTTTAQSFTVVMGGNPEIKPEKGDTFTVGLVYQPDWLPGFDMSVDWLRVKLSDAIEQYSAQDIVNKCYLEGDQDQCSKITRDASSGTDVIIFVNQSKQNINKSMYDGVDFELGYSHGIHVFGGAERLSARLFGTYLRESSTTNFAGVKTDNTGSLPAQLFTKKANMVLTYMNGPFSWNLNGRYNNGGYTSSTWNVPPATGAITWVADNHTGGSVYWDTRIGYRLSVGGGDLELFGNVQNLFDRDPPLVLQQGIGLQTAGGYDQIGRRYVVGVNLKF